MAQVIGSIGEELDLVIRQGATFGPFNLTMVNPNATPVDLTGATFRGSIRKTPAGAWVQPVHFLVIDAVAGRYDMWIPDTETSLIKAGPTLTHSDSKYIWDAEMVDSSGNVIALYYGKVLVFRDVTHA